MRFLTIAIALSFLAVPIARPAQACGPGAHAAKAATADYSAATKKKKPKQPKEKVEYMRAAPMK
jgi:hypothetical protein